MVKRMALFEPCAVKNVVIRNRIVMPAMNNNFADADGSVNDRFLRYFVERGKGGVGLIIVSPAYIDPKARKRVGSLLLHEDRYINKLQEFTTAVHATGAKLLQQLNHNGRLITSSKDLKTAVTGGAVGPSPIPHLSTGEIPHVLTVGEIRDLIEKYAQAALRAKKAGFDGVELHGSHGYLINQFYSMYSNRRMDEYGGSLENRMRFPLEVYRRVRELTGNDFLICYRLNSKEFAPVETPIADVIALSQCLEKEGIDLLHISAGNSETPTMSLRVTPPGSFPRGCYAEWAAVIKAEVKVPVIAVGRINTPEVAEEILQKGKADLVATGRALIADPYWPEKALRGEGKKIRRCIGCNQGCMDQLVQEKGITCIYNPEVGREGELVSAMERKKVWVVGGGPGGMEAAAVAATRGHDVTLYEKEGELGGQSILAAIPPGKEEFKAVRDFLIDELKRLGGATYTSKNINREEIENDRPEVVIVATGSSSLIPDIPGIDKQIVVTARDVLRGKTVGEKVVVVGGGLVGIETALFLFEKGKIVYLIEVLEEVGRDAGPLNRARLKEELGRTSIDARCKTELLRVEENGVRVLGEIGEYSIPVETVVLALGSKPQDSFRDIEGSKIAQVHSIGDCVKPRKMIEAIHEAFDVAIRI